MIALGSEPSSIKLLPLLPFSLEVALVAASLSLFINYIIGKPGGEFSPYEILSSYTVWLSKMRLKKLGIYDELKRQGNFRPKDEPHITLIKKRDLKIILYNSAEPFFTWERAFGMCVICTGFWISLAAGLVAIWFNGQSFLSLVEIIVFSHIIIRILAKII